MPSIERRTFLVEPCVMPFCKNCGHRHVVKRLDEALTSLQLPPADVCLVTDVGCIGLADALFSSPHTVHTAQGRSAGLAAGIQLADAILASNRLKTVVLVGDGGAMTGLQHLLHDALWNVDVTVLLCNNFLFGVNSHRGSAFTPCGWVTPSTLHGNLAPPLDLCKLVAAAGAGFVARKLATDDDLAHVIGEAIAYPGFALVEVVEMCTEHGAADNARTGRNLIDLLRRNGQTLGLQPAAEARPDFGRVYRESFPAPSNGPDRTAARVPVPNAIPRAHRSTLDAPVGIVVAGTAGERVQSAARWFCEAALRSGLHCTQKRDVPVTRGSGFSLAEVIVSPRPIDYTGIEVPDAAVVVSEDGLREVADRGLLGSMPRRALLLLDTSLQVPECAATVYCDPFRSQHGAARAARAGLETYVAVSGIFPVEALENH